MISKQMRIDMASINILAIQLNLSRPARSWVIRLWLTVALILDFLTIPTFAWDYGNGRHGSFVLTTNATIEQLYQIVRLPSDPKHYNPSDQNSIPNFQFFTITNGATLTAQQWDGTSGGWIVFKVEATLTVAYGAAISATAIGYRGGGGFHQGESFMGDQYVSQLANFGGGGAGYEMPNGHFTSAGGGGYGSEGATGGGNPYTTYNSTDYCGRGGSEYGDESLSTIYLGSGGGGGGVYAPRPHIYSFTGGSGGGVIVLHAGNLVNNGQIQANGGSPHYELSGPPEIVSNGGGGSGGTIVLRVKTATLGVNQVLASGGSGSGNGGGGGLGRIKIEYFSNYTGTTVPGAYILLDTNSDNITTITTQPSSQTNFWSSNAFMSVELAGYSPFAFQWYFSGLPIPGATNQVLSLPGLDFTNQGIYFVNVSNAVMAITSSNAFLTVLDGKDSDGDGIPNYWEQQYGGNLNNPNDATNQPAGDKLTYLQKYLCGLNPLTTDSDGDGLNDYDELFIYGSNPLSANTSGEVISDSWKVQHGLSPLVANANNEAGYDGVTYMQIYQYNQTNATPLDPQRPFAVGQGLSNYEIINNGLHTNRYYYDHEDRLLGMESSRGFSIGYVYDGNGSLVRQVVLSRGTEYDGLPALWRFLNGLTNNTSPYVDTDGDGWTDYQEYKAGTNPTDTQSTPYGYGNPGNNIGAVIAPFTPSKYVLGVGQLAGMAQEEIVVGADGIIGTNSNTLVVFKQTAQGWSTQQVNIGPFGVTSIAVGHITNRPGPAIYVGVRQNGGTGRILEVNNYGGQWQTSTVASSINDSAFVLGTHGTDLVAILTMTNEANNALCSLKYTTKWDITPLSINASSQCVGTVLGSSLNNDSPDIMRVIDSGDIEYNYVGEGGNFAEIQKGSLGSNLTAYYEFNDTMDEVGHYSLSNNNGVMFKRGFIGNGADFGATNVNKVLSASTNYGILWGSSFTYSCWIKLWNDITNDRWTIWNINPEPGNEMKLAYDYNVGNRCLTFARYSPQKGICDSIYNIMTLGTEKWNHVVVTYDGETMKMYVNGSCVGSKYSSPTPGGGNQYSTGSAIGACLNGAQVTEYTSANIDEVGIWSRVLTAFEINELYNKGVAGQYGSFQFSDINAQNVLCQNTSLVAEKSRILFKNSTSLFCCYTEDINNNGLVDHGDKYVVSEYIISGTNQTRMTYYKTTIETMRSAQIYGQAYVTLINGSNGVLFTGEPDGKIFAWKMVSDTKSLERQLFSAKYEGKEWHALVGVKTYDVGESLVGLVVDPIQPNRCDLILWPPRSDLAFQPITPQTPPMARILPEPCRGTGLAAVRIRVWDAEGNDALPTIQYKIPGSTNWADATITMIDAITWDTTHHISAQPGGSEHTMTWDVANDLGAISTNVWLRVRAADLTLLGEWSEPTLYSVEASLDVDVDGLPDAWEQAYFHDLVQGPTGDPDADGLNNIGEYLAGTDPTDGKSYLQLNLEPVTEGVRLEWVSSLLFTQYLQQRFSIDEDNETWLDIHTNPPASPGIFTNRWSTNTASFYRLRLKK